MHQTIKNFANDVRIRSFEQEDNHWEIVFELRFLNNMENQGEKLLHEINSLDGISKVSLLAPQLALPL